jgi:FAD/FMN-containing dehydrogenase
MGGQSLARNGIAVDMRPYAAMSLDADRDILHVQAGATWAEVIPYLNAHGRSVAVMQSNNSFTVGGSVSVNCHGWQSRRPPIASTVQGLRIVTADGEVVRCSRTENPELFSLALGGYGLLGVILEVDLQVVPNEEYRTQRAVMGIRDYADRFEQVVGSDSSVGMAFGRLSVAPESFLREAILTWFERQPGGSGQPSALGFPELESATRLVVRGQVGSDYGKSLRWSLERNVGQALSQTMVHRNQLLNEPVAVFENRSRESTDILQEYFVPITHFEEFVEGTRAILSRRPQDLLNVTVRDVARDEDSVLRYADQRMFAFVMLFNQARTEAAERSMESTTRDLVDLAISLGGRHYLPYRLHATPTQLRAAYPQIDRFLELKSKYDPKHVFQNAFYRRYANVDEVHP